MTAIITLIAVIALSMLIVRIGTIALTMTGLSEEVASFQSLSAFSGAGFTTGEAEGVVLTRARRKIIKTLIRLGSIGIVTVMASLILSFGGDQGGSSRQFLILGFGLVLLVLVTRSSWFDRLLTPAIRWFLRKSAAVELRDYAALLHLRQGYTVAEITATSRGRLAGGMLGELGLTESGVTVLGVIKPDSYVGAPADDYRIEQGDRLVVYGEADKLVEVASEGRGDVVDPLDEDAAPGEIPPKLSGGTE